MLLPVNSVNGFKAVKFVLLTDIAFEIVDVLFEIRMVEHWAHAVDDCSSFPLLNWGNLMNENEFLRESLKTLQEELFNIMK